MKQRELARLQVLNDILEYQVPTAQAAEILGVSERHTRRLLSAYRRDGAAALAHGNRGRRPPNAVLESEAAAVVWLASTKYAGTNHTHLTELLRERDGINLSRPTVRRILVKAGIGSPRSRRSQQHRVRRQRMPQEGMLGQIDGPGLEASQIKGATTQYTHCSPEGSVGECATGQTQGALPSGNRPRVRHPPKHRPQVRLGQKPATEKHQWHDWDTIIQGGRFRLIGHFRRPIGRTLSLDINTGANTLLGNGALSTTSPGKEEADVYLWFRQSKRCTTAPDIHPTSLCP